MGLDIRIPIGLLFALFGMILSTFGIFSDPDLYRQSLGINVNLYCGLGLTVFGAAMLALAWRSARSAGKTTE